MFADKAPKKYLAFPCENCREPIPAPGAAYTPVTPDTRHHSLRLTCPNCDHEAEYRLRDMYRFEENHIHQVGSGHLVMEGRQRLFRRRRFTPPKLMG